MDTVAVSVPWSICVSRRTMPLSNSAPSEVVSMAWVTVSSVALAVPLVVAEPSASVADPAWIAIHPIVSVPCAPLSTALWLSFSCSVMSKPELVILLGSLST